MKRLWLFGAVLSLSFLVIPLSKAAAADRIGAVFTDGNVWLKEGPASGVWRQMTGGVNVGDLDLTDDWMTVLDANTGIDDVSVKEPFWNSQWHLSFGGLGFDAKKVATSRLSDGNYRLLVLAQDGKLYMKDGVKNSGWWSGTQEPDSGNITEVYAAEDRIGILMDNGDLLVKNLVPRNIGHPNNVQWELQSQNVLDVAITDNRIAYVRNDNTAHAKEGPTNAPWFLGGPGFIFDNAKEVRLGGNRMCVIKTNDDVECKEGGLGATSVLTYDNVADFKLNDKRFVALTKANSAFVMEGPLYNNRNGWQFIAIGNVTRLELN